MIKKRRSDIAKLVSKAREVWRQSLVYQQVKKDCRIPKKSGWFECRHCCQQVEVIRIDHIVPIGKQPRELGEFGAWLERLFCDPKNLQGLCNACHKLKTKLEKKHEQF